MEPAEFFFDRNKGPFDFHRYEDPLVQSIRDWEIRAARWNECVSYFYQQAPSTEQFREAETHLAETQLNYIYQLQRTASAISADSPLPELAMETIEKLLRDDDAKRCNRLRNWYTRTDIEAPPNEYFRDIAMAFGDPHGITLTSSDQPVFDVGMVTDLAIELYTARLDDLSHQILGKLRLYNSIREEQSNNRSLGSIALRILGRFKRQS